MSAGKAGKKEDDNGNPIDVIDGPATTKTMLTKNPETFDKFYNEKLYQQDLEEE